MKKNIAGWIICFLMVTFAALANITLAQGYDDDSYDRSLPDPTPIPPPPTLTPEKQEPAAIPPKHPAVEIFSEIEHLQFIGGQNIVLKANIIFYQQINPFWEELTKINFSPFKLEKIVLSERKIFDQEKDLSRDFRRATFLLSLPASDCGPYTIPSFSLNYSHFKDKNEIKEKAESTAIEVEKVPILINYSLEKDAMAVGETNALRLIIQRERHIRILNFELESAKNSADIAKEDFRRWLKSLETRNKKITDLNRPAFGKFRISSSSMRSESGNIQKEIFEYHFSFYENPAETQIPDFHIWYMNEKERQQPKEIAIKPRPILISSAISPNRRSVEWLKEPKRFSEKNVYYFGYAPLVLGGILLIIFGVSALTSIIIKKPEGDVSDEICEPAYKTWNRLLCLNHGFDLTDDQARAFMKRARNGLAEASGSIFGIPANRARAKTALEIADAFRQNGFSENIAQEIQSCLRKIDESIQNLAPNQSAPAIHETMNRIKKIANFPEIAKLLKKQKKS